MKKKVKVGVIGCGVMGGFHLKQYGSIPDVEIVGVSDIDPARAPQGVKFFKDYRDLLKISDAISITTPTSTHFEVGMAALDAGCHVLIEKPISATVDQGEKLIKNAKAKKKVLAVGHIERFNPAFISLKKQLKNMKPSVIDIKRLSPLPARITDVSVVIDMMIHDIDLAIDLAGAEVKTIKASGEKVATSRLDKVNAVIVFNNGVIANIEASRANNDKVRKLIVAGKGTYEADLLNKTLNNIKVSGPDQLQTELKSFINSVVSGKKPPVAGEDGLAALDAAIKIEGMALQS
jgi:virulence factor